MFEKLLQWIGRASAERTRREGERCETCRYFIDYRDIEPDPDECNGYCCHDLINKVPNEYGGHWTHDQSWCASWLGGDPCFGKPEADDAVDPHAGSTPV